MYNNALVHILESGNVTVETLKTSFTVQSAASPDDIVNLYGAVLDSNGDMVCIGDFVEVKKTEDTVSM